MRTWTGSYRWLIAGGGIVVVFLILLATLGTEGTFRLWGIQATSPDFADTRGFTHAAEYHATGGNPYLGNPMDPWARPFNYPRVWLALGSDWITRQDTAWLARLFIFSLLAGLLLFPRASMRWSGCTATLAIAFSPAVILGMERGNIDQLMFFLVAAAVPCLAGSPRWGRLAGISAILVAFVLKIYPLLALAAVPHERGKKMWITASVVVVLVAAYLIITWNDLRLIQAATPRATGVSYGKDVLWMEVAQHNVTLGSVAKIVCWAGVLAAAALFTAGFFRVSGKLPVEAQDRKPLVAFLAGAGIYGGTFVLGNNWDYRLIFVILMVPLITILAKSGEKTWKWLGITLLAASLVSTWSILIYQIISRLPGGSPASFLLDEAANWVLFLGSAWLAGCLLPSLADHETAITSRSGR